MILTDEHLIWIDLETTGLSAKKDMPLELGLAITDKWGDISAQHKWLVYEDTLAFKKAMGRGYAHPVVGSMHEKSGLWDDLVERQAFALTRSNLDGVADSWLGDHGVVKGKLAMAGSSIGSLDRPFVLEHFPLLNERFSYRNVDISSIKELCRRLNPRIFEKMPEVTGYNPTKVSHRVLGDIWDSIVEYKYYVDNFLFVAEDA